MTGPLMPKATAVWLVDNTALTFEQISDFCGLHMLEIQAIADDEVAVGMQGLDPVRGGELDAELIKACEADPDKRLEITKAAADHAKQQSRKKGRYTPVSKRQDRPDAIAWLLKNYPDLTDAQISKLVGTTKPTINAVRDRTHWNTPNITAQNPVGLGLCSGADLEKAISVARARTGTVLADAEPLQSEQAPGPLNEVPSEPVPVPVSEPVAAQEPLAPQPAEQPQAAESSINAESVFGPKKEETAAQGDSGPFAALAGLGAGSDDSEKT